MQSQNIEINEQFKRALELLENTSKNVLITGRAGTGKSTLLDYFVHHTQKEVVVLAPTGVAAVNVGGQTIHSFFGFKPGITVDKVKKAYGPNSETYKMVDRIIIDEVSMVRADLFDCVDRFLRLNGPDSSKPFGGVQMAFIGDLYQLPPVVKGEEKGVFKTHYKSPYFFDAHLFQKLKVEFIELEKIYRQTDQEFIRLLNAVRNKSVTEEDLKKINKRLAPKFEPSSDEFYINLTTTNKLSEEINNKELGKLSSKLFTFKGKIAGDFDKSYLPTEEVLNIKEGSQIMLLNNDLAHRWVNGTVGKIIEIEEDKKNTTIKAKLEDGKTVKIIRHKWDLNQVVYNAKAKKIESKVIGSFVQYPLRLAWSVTIHKGQGKTFDKIIIDIGSGTFTHGQAYVALSRCRSLQGIVLKKPIEKKHIWMDWRVVNFLTKFQYSLADKKLSLDEKIGLIKKAIKSKCNLDITYLKSNDEKSKRTIAPKRVGAMDYLGKSYLGVEGYCFTRKEDRTFRVDRILEIKLSQ
ncbi:AAA family ATPase [Candidatus Pacearchaeota archaeon RBG_13_36_9]|nr:MAG: AAA family ATPase [Candidatus Pacearchaeota archaeon RBG_13_36_9]